jgi:ABC-type uncharacterized transport system involved in gliding motility auxiliary subunit
MSFPESFRAARWIRTLNLVLQALLFVSFFGGLNYLSLRYSWRFDLTEHRRYSLSPETLSYLSTLRQPVQIYVTIPEEDPEYPTTEQAHRDVSGLLREYVYATERSETGRISVRYVDINLQPREAQQLGIDRADIVLVVSAGGRRAVQIEELYELKDRRRESFRGERAITAAILDVSSLERKRIYFLAGHGEMSPTDTDGTRGLSAFAEELRLRNYDIAQVDLMQNRRIPEDAALLVIAGPAGRYDPFEVELLRSYLNAGAGRVIALLAPATSHGLNALFSDWGIRAGDDVLVLDTDPAHITQNGDLRIGAFDANHPITRTLIDLGLPLTLGPTRVATLDPERALDAGLKVTVLAGSSETAWGEANYRATTAAYNPGIDLKGRPDVAPENKLGLITASERVVPPKDLPFSVRGGRIVVFGNADLASNRRITTIGNQFILLNAVNWCLDRDTQLSIPTRPIELFQLSLSQQELVRLRYSLMLALPGIAAVFGLIVYWTRRR